MGRKTNSVSLRLKKTNRDYNHCWYGDILYGYHFTESLKIQDLLLESLKTIDVSYPKMSLIAAYKKVNLLVCYLQRSKTLFSENIENTRKPKVLNPFTSGKHGKSFDQKSKTFRSNSSPDFNDIQKSQPKALTKVTTKGTNQDQDFSYKNKKKFISTFQGIQACIPTCKKKSFNVLENSNLKKNVYNYKGPLGLTFSFYSKEISCNTFCKNKFSFFPSTISLSSYGETINKKSISNFQKSIDSFYFLTGLSSLEKTCKINKEKCQTSVFIDKRKNARQGTVAGPSVQAKDSNLKDHNDLFYNTFEKSIEIKPKKYIESNLFFIWNLASKSSAFWKNGVCISFIKSRNEKACALFLAHYVSYFLEKKVLFRQIKRELSFMSLKNTNTSFTFLTSSVLELCKKFKKNQSQIKGLRISCSGRVGGRSKKAQRSRKETFMWGETGLHVFSNKLDFAQTHAETSFGLVGVQVWICYK